jgi:hypothetical protein
MLIQLHKKNGCIIEFECDLTDAEARKIVIDADRANQNVGDFALQLATQRRGLTQAQSGWLRYLAMEISGQLRPQILAGPWAWLLSQPTYETVHIRVTTPPEFEVAPGEPAQLHAVCRWVFVKRRSEDAVSVNPVGIGGMKDSQPWQYVGLIDSNGGFYFSKHLTALISGEGRQTMAVMFPTEEQQLQDEAKWLQWRTNQLMEALKRSNPV